MSSPSSGELGRFLVLLGQWNAEIVGVELDLRSLGPRRHDGQGRSSPEGEIFDLCDELWVLLECVPVESAFAYASELTNAALASDALDDCVFRHTIGDHHLVLARATQLDLPAAKEDRLRALPGKLVEARQHKSYKFCNVLFLQRREGIDGGSVHVLELLDLLIERRLLHQPLAAYFRNAAQQLVCTADYLPDAANSCGQLQTPPKCQMY
jgi:hypothetical protein